MVVRKRKKFSRQRGYTTHGWGSKKKHRGAGSRGGRGKGGSGKRAAEAKKPSFWKDLKRFGKFGFKFKGVRIKVNPINICDLSKNLDSMVASKAAVKKGDAYEIDLGKAGYNKLLGKGPADIKMNITVDAASSKAIKKIEKAGGKVVLPAKEKTEEVKTTPAKEG